MENINDLQNKIIADIQAAPDLKALEDIRVSSLGKKGLITEEMKTLGAMEADARIEKAKELNVLKSAVEEALALRKTSLEEAALNEKLKTETIDVTLPVRPETQGRIHPISKIFEEVFAIFGELGFDVAEVRILKISFTILML